VAADKSATYIYSWYHINITNVGINIFLIKKLWQRTSQQHIFICECSVSHKKNSFAESKNLARYKSENNFVGSLK